MAVPSKIYEMNDIHLFSIALWSIFVIGRMIKIPREMISLLSLSKMRVWLPGFQ
jgi:hypothetical protein